MESVGYYNGTFAPLCELMVPALDRGYYFGDGVYEALRVEHHKPFAMQEHLERLYRSLAEIWIAFTMTPQELEDILKEVYRRADGDSLILYLQVTRGTDYRSHTFCEGVMPNIMACARSSPLADITERKNVISLPDLRWGRCDIKTLNLLPNILAAQQAKERGCKEAVFVRDGVVSECTSANLLMLKRGVLRTAPESRSILAGVTRGQFLRLARELGVPVREEAFTLAEAMAADELLITSTSVHGAPVGALDGVPVGGKDPALLNRLQTAFREYFYSGVGRPL